MIVHIVEPSVQILTSRSDIEDFPKRIERAGRVCYRSEHKTTENSSDDFIRKIVSRGHDSVLEHCSVTCLFTISRACSHQLVRHRLASYSQESQRYNSYSESIRIIIPQNITKEKLKLFMNSVNIAIETYKDLVSTKTKLEDARYILPNCIASDIVATFNIRELRHIFSIRQWEIRNVFKKLFEELNILVPCLFVSI